MAAAPPLPKQSVVAVYIYRFPGTRPVLPIIVWPPTNSKEREKKRPLTPKKKKYVCTKEMTKNM